MKNTLILVLLIGLFACKKKEETTPEPEPPPTTNTSQKKVYCIHTNDNGGKNLQCGEMTTDEAIKVCQDYRKQQINADATVKSSCAACPL